MPHPLLALLLFAPQTVRLTPTDDVWVYPHAADPGHDANLRVWGVSGRGAPDDAADAEELSMAYLRWDLSSLPAGKRLTKATLVVTNIPNAGYTVDQAKAAPLQVRPVGWTFDEKSWTFEGVGKLLPDKDKEHVYGSAYPTALVPDKPTTIEIDLLKGPGDFRKALDESLTKPERRLAVALTSPIDMASLGRTAIYKLYSRDEKDETLRPQLVLVFE